MSACWLYECRDVTPPGWQARAPSCPCCHAVLPRPRPSLPIPGEDTTVLFGFLSTLLNLLELAPPPTHFAVVFDSPGKTFRRGCPGHPSRPKPAFMHVMCMACRGRVLGTSLGGAPACWRSQSSLARGKQTADARPAA